MAKWNPDTMVDQALAWVKTNTAQLCVCSSEPNTYAEATSTYKLGQKAHTISGSPQDWGSSGREIAVDALSSVSISTPGTAAHIALVHSSVGSAQVLAYVTDISSQVVAASDKVNVATWDIRIADVTP